MRKSRGVKSSVVLMLAVAAAAVMLNVGCEDSELARLLGLSKKKNDSAVQPSQQQDAKSVSENEKETTSENSKTTENSDGKENGSEDGAQSGNDNSTQNSEGTPNAQNNYGCSTQDGNLQQTQSDGNTNEQTNDNSTQNSEGASDVQNNNDGSNQDENLQQTQSDGNTNGQVNDGESQTPTIQAGDISQAQSPETVGESQIQTSTSTSEIIGGIQPLDIVVPSGKNYIKVLQLFGNRNPNDLGYAGTWEYFDSTPVDTEKIIYGTTEPNALGEVGTWEFVDSSKEIIYSFWKAVPNYDRTEDVDINVGGGIRCLVLKTGFLVVNPVIYVETSTYPVTVSLTDDLNAARDYVEGFNPTDVPTGASSTMGLFTYRASLGGAHLTWSGVNLHYQDGSVAFYCNQADTAITWKTAQSDANNTWKKTELSKVPADNRVNNWGRIN
jgi:hypothetical protein